MDQETATQILLAAGIDPDFFDESARFDFLQTCKEGPNEKLVAFLVCGMPVDDASDREPPIIKASSGGVLERILILRSYGASLDERDVSGDTPLHTAVNWERSRLVRQLLQAGAHPDTVNNKNWTPLTFAVHKGNIELVNLLLEHGVDPDFSGPEGGALLFALDNPSLAARLLEAGANPERKLGPYDTLLLRAASRDQAETAPTTPRRRRRGSSQPVWMDSPEWLLIDRT
ncbi:MAG: ankyrin repeat domain-containing protein [Bradymonadaceae bacterium]